MKSLLGKFITKCRGIILKVGIKLGIIKSDSIYYMGGVNILPPPLKPDEENALLQRLEKDESVKTTLIERNLRLVVYISRKFENTGIDVCLLYTSKEYRISKFKTISTSSSIFRGYGKCTRCV